MTVINLSDVKIPDKNAEFHSHKKYTADELGEKLYAVHVTRRLIKNGVLEATLRNGAGSGHSPHVAKLLEDSRFTAHFSIGEVTRGFSGMGLEKCPYAVVTPLKELYPQLVNLNAYDTFIQGDYHFSSKTALVLPSTVSLKEVAAGPTIYLYDPKKINLRKAVDKVIRLQGGWHVKMKDQEDEYHLLSARVDKTNINTRSFYKRIVKKLPHVSIGLRSSMLDGEAHRFATVEACVDHISRSFFPKYKAFPVMPLEISKVVLEHTVSKIQSHFASAVTQKNQNVVARKIGKVMQFVTLANAELYLRKQKRTLALTTSALIDEALELASTPQAFEEFAKKNEKKLGKMSKDSHQSKVATVAKALKKEYKKKMIDPDLYKKIRSVVKELQA